MVRIAARAVYAIGSTDLENSLWSKGREFRAPQQRNCSAMAGNCYADRELRSFLDGANICGKMDTVAKFGSGHAAITGDILGRTDRDRRVYRWLFNALHSFDLPILLSHRPAWDGVVWLLSLLGMIISVIVIGWQYLRR